VGRSRCRRHKGAGRCGGYIRGGYRIRATIDSGPSRRRGDGRGRAHHSGHGGCGRFSSRRGRRGGGGNRGRGGGGGAFRTASTVARRARADSPRETLGSSRTLGERRDRHRPRRSDVRRSTRRGRRARGHDGHRHRGRHHRRRATAPRLERDGRRVRAHAGGSGGPAVRVREPRLLGAVLQRKRLGALCPATGWARCPPSWRSVARATRPS